MTPTADGPIRPSLPGPLAPLSEQLWFAVDPSIRFRVRPPRSVRRDDVVVVERYWLLPSPGRARLLLPAANRPVTARSADNYRSLRSPRERAARTIIGAIARSGSPIGLKLLHLEAPAAAAATASTSLPTSAVAAALGREDVYAAVGIRTGANAKATLQLVDASGVPVGYAKLGWNPTTDGYVRTEAAALAAVVANAVTRAPAVLATFEYSGHPVVVTEPLPSDVRSVQGGVAPPTSAELHALCPIVRNGLPASTEHLRGLRGRLKSITLPLAAGLAGRALALLDSAAAVDVDLPVTARWHGDLTPWNCARDTSGMLWVWDWESSETDALAGLDALHWAYSTERRRGADLAGITIDDCLDAASRHLVAAGIPRTHWRTIAQVYVATMIERACSLAQASEGWDRVWIDPAQLTSLANQVAE